MYQGYLIKFGTSEQQQFILPNSYVSAETYNVTSNGQDLDSFRNTDGTLVRDALENRIIKAEFNLRPMLSDTEFRVLFGKIQDLFDNDAEKSVWASVYDPEYGVYRYDKYYLPDIKFEVYQASSTKLIYKAIRIALIGYGEKN